MEISIITDEVSQNFEYTLDFLAKLGVKNIELRSIWGKNVANLNKEELLKLSDLIEEKGLRVSALATPIFKCPLFDDSPILIDTDKFFVKGDTYNEHMRMLRFSFKLAKVLKTNRIRVFSFLKVNNIKGAWQEIVNRLQHAAFLASKYNLFLILENEHTCNICDTNLILKFFRSINYTNMKLLWDPCNSLIFGNNPIEEYRKIKKYICYVHIKNVVLDDNNSYKYTKISDGIIDYKTLICKMIRDNYKGCISLEPHIKTTELKVKENIIKDSFTFLKKLMKDEG